MQQLGRNSRRENAGACQHAPEAVTHELTFVLRELAAIDCCVPDIVRRVQPAPTSSREQQRTNRS
jgi:hypothetical protein